MRPTVFRLAEIVTGREAVAFAEFSGDDVIDPDTAATLEGIATILKELSPTDRAAFIAFTEELAREEAAAGNKERAEFMLQTPDALGLRTDA